MWVRPLLAIAIAVTVIPAAAGPLEDHLSCEPASVQRFRVSGNHRRLRLRATFTPPAGFGFDPVANGLYVEFGLEPETDPANVLEAAALPAARFQKRGKAIRYRDSSGSVGGITQVNITQGPGLATNIVVVRAGSLLPAVQHAGAGRIVLSSGSGCLRTCPSPCTVGVTGRLSCQPSTDTTLCGVMSGCELLNIEDAQTVGGGCLFPYPSSVFLASDPTTPTGKRMHYGLRATPVNKDGVHIATDPYTTLDGYSPGPILTVNFPAGVDLAASNVPPLNDFPASLDPASPTLLVEADTPGCVRIEHFGENDVSAGIDGMTPVAPPTQAFMVRPGRRLKNGTRYIAALRGLIDQQGHTIAPSTAFKALRDGTPSGSTAVEARRPAMNAILQKLATDCGVATGNLIVAWDFTTASDDAIERYLLHMRDDALAKIGASAPPFVVESIQDHPFGGDSPERICRLVQGTFTVPLYTTFNGPGSLLNIDPATNLPVQNGVASDVPFRVAIPCSLIGPPAHAGRPIFYGHGLLGSAAEVTADNLRTLANTYGFVMAATDWQGFSALDQGTVLAFINDLSDFRKLPERLHQGILNQLVLAHLLIAPGGLSEDPSLQFDDGTGHLISVIDTSEVFYYGNSQGGIEGGAVMAISTEATRGVLGVAAANFSTLLQRADPFRPFFDLLRGSYPDDLSRAMIYPFLQQLWDRAEPNGYYHHTLSNPLPNTPTHKVLVHMSFGDAQVTNIGTEIMVRSMGLPQVAPVLEHFFGIPEIPAPFDGSAMLEANVGGVPREPITNNPPLANAAHGGMRALPAVQQQIDRFLRTGGDVEDFCGGPCGPPVPP